MPWLAAIAILWTAVAPTSLPPISQFPIWHSPTNATTSPESLPPAKLFSTPAALHKYPVNTNQPPGTNYTIPLRWNTNQLVGKTAFDVQESHDLKSWRTIQTNVQGDPWVTNSGNPTFWRIFAR
jgi:hypothetical protein